MSSGIEEKWVEYLRKKDKSGPSEPKHQSPRRSHASPTQNPTNPFDNHLVRPPTTDGKLWKPDRNDAPTTPGPPPNGGFLPEPPVAAAAAGAAANSVDTTNTRPPDDARPHDESQTQDHTPPQSEPYDMLPQPTTRPITQDQLVTEVKGIYAGLVMVESKCIEVDKAQSATHGDVTPKLNHGQWQALIALHRTLLHEHHDFFLASQHPSASPALRRLPKKYSMPARMWRHGIYAFLELLRQHLPESAEHMLCFIYLSYSMVALLYETVPTFKETWIECLGDLGRYRMAIEDESPRDREIWTAVSRRWYSMASDSSPVTGRLYHHLAILSRPFPLQQLFYYTKSLSVPIPFASARESIMTLLDPALNNSDKSANVDPVDSHYVRSHALLFSRRNLERLPQSTRDFTQELSGHIARKTRLWVESSYYIALSLICALFSYGSEQNVLGRDLKAALAADQIKDKLGPALEETREPPVEPAPDQEGDNAEKKAFQGALHLFHMTSTVVMKQHGDPDVYPYLHCILVFLNTLAAHPKVMRHIEGYVPWSLASRALNTLSRSAPTDSTEAVTVDTAALGKFPRGGDKDTRRLLPEDFAMRGFNWSDPYFPPEWFSQDKIDDEEKYFEVPSMGEERRVSCLWLGCSIASKGQWLLYDAATDMFSAGPRHKYDGAVEGFGGADGWPPSNLMLGKQHPDAMDLGQNVCS